MRETVVETYLRNQCKANGFLCYKFTSPSNVGVPDRVIIGHGLTLFVETKAPGKTLRQSQELKVGEMRKHGALVYVIDTKEKVDKWLELVLSAVGINDVKKFKNSKTKMECLGQLKDMKTVKLRTDEAYDIS